MGMHFGLIAARVPLSQLRDSFSEVWPNLEITLTADGFDDVDEIWSWKTANDRFVSAAKWSKENPGAECYVFCQDGLWAVLLDFSYVLSADEEALKKLSIKLGAVLSFVVETTGGSAHFSCCESGQLRRNIYNVDGEVKQSGAPLPEEQGIDTSGYYMGETESLMRAFGLSHIEKLPVVSTAVAICTVDRTDYSDSPWRNTQSNSAEAKQSSSRKRWWKFW